MTIRTLLRTVVALTTTCAFMQLSAQSQTRFNYQAQIRNAGDAVLPNVPVVIRVSIRMGTSTGDDVYREVHSDTTSAIGLVNILVGAGIPEAGNIDAIAWGDTSYYLKIDVDFDDDGFFDEMGGAPIVSVPIAEFARNASTSYWIPDENGIHYDQGDVGIGLTDPNYKLDVNGVVRSVSSASHTKFILEAATPALDNVIGSYDENHDRQWTINMLDRSAGNRFHVYSDVLNDWVLALQDDGRTQVKCLEILGGCDINERFHSAETLEPGTIVIADPGHPGQVCMTNRPYDQRVVGAISGANGIKPGLTLTQEGTALDGTHPVALDGRVYVKVTGSVEVGDLLTTSNEPGRAMAVKNRKKAFGAVIGKALESDSDGDGLVLMLVQPR